MFRRTTSNSPKIQTVSQSFRVNSNVNQQSNVLYGIEGTNGPRTRLQGAKTDPRPFYFENILKKKFQKKSESTPDFWDSDPD